VSLRVVFADTVNGQLLLGAPSPPVRVESGGSPAAILMQIPLPPSVVVGMSVQIYVTQPVAAADPTGDEMALAANVIVTSANVTAGFVVTTILSTPTTLGAALYTNETQEGILQANTVPPAAKAIAWFHQMAFYGDVQDLGEVLTGETSSVGLADAVGATSALLTGLGATMGSATLTGVSMGHGLQAGAYLTQDGLVSVAGTRIDANTKILSVGATTITMDKAALSTGSVDVMVLGILTIDGAGTLNLINGGVTDGTRQFTSPTELAALVAAYYPVTEVTLDLSDYESSVYTITWRSADSFTVAYTGAKTGSTLVGLYGITPVASGAAESSPARLMWSKIDQPEAVPTLNFVEIGDYRQPIMALSPTRDSLFVLKADGVWRVTGDTPETLRVEAYDSTLHLLHRRACDTHENAAWAWTTQGIVSITEAGTERVGSPIANMISGQAESIRDSPFPVGGVFIASCTQQRCVLVGIQEGGEADSPTGFVCLYESENGAWTRWVTAGYPWRGAAEYSGQIVIVGGDEVAEVGTQGATRDRLAGVEVAAPTGVLTYTITGLDGADAVGARVDRGDSTAWVTEHVSGDTYVVTAELTLGDAQASYAVPVNVQWAAAPTSGSYVHWRQMRAQMGYIQNTYRVTFGFGSERAPTESTVHVSFSEVNNGRGVTPIRMMVSRAQSRCARLRPSMSVRSAGQGWTLEGLTLTGEPMRGSEKMP
jgi:hypothetical protein